MKIADTHISMNSSRTYLETNEVKESLRVWVSQTAPLNARHPDQVTISPKAESMLKRFENELGEAGIEENMDGEILLKKLITEILSGREVKLSRIEKVSGRGSEMAEEAKEAATKENQRQGWGMLYDYEQTHHEKEDVSFQAKGIIKTADGKEVVFAFKLDMSREHLEKNSINIRAGDVAIDPLIINFDGNAADLSSMKFEFDLDSDGQVEQVSVPTAGRGFLAIDLDNSNTIDNGSELFGPSTGNGFAELSAYDEDGNSWIDENDEAYSRLRVMTVDSNGSSILQTLKDTGAGAIYLGRSTTRFDIRTSSDNSLLGQVRTTGIYLHEDGTPGTIQQLDLIA